MSKVPGRLLILLIDRFECVMAAVTFNTDETEVIYKFRKYAYFIVDKSKPLC